MRFCFPAQERFFLSALEMIGGLWYTDACNFDFPSHEVNAMMNQRDLSELRRRLNPDRRNPTLLCGCYLTGDGRVISSFAQPIGSLPQEENEKYMAIFKRCLSGTAGQNLLPMDFSTAQEEDGEEHRLLTRLCDSALGDEEAVGAFYQRMIAYAQAEFAHKAQSVQEQQGTDNYLVLLLHDGYDVPYRDNNGEIDREQSASVFNYVLCALCPVKQAKPALRYVAAQSQFHSREDDWVVGAPELGFLFPAFEERGANVHRALYYTRDAGNLHEDFLRLAFGTQPPMNADEQKETFQAILQESLQEECSLDVVQTVHETISGMLEERKADKTAEPLTLSAPEMKKVLEECGVSEAKAAAFEEHYTATFGEKAELPAVNMVSNKFKVSTPAVNIQVDPEHAGLIETRMIDGRRYIVILADGDVEVNGVKVYEAPEK